MEKMRALTKEVGKKYRRKRQEDKVKIRISEKLIRNHTINYLPNQNIIYKILSINTHLYFK